MPRQAHGRPLQPGKINGIKKKRTAQNRGLSALEIAEREHPDEIKIRQHRLGHIEDEDEDPRARANENERSSKRRKIDIAQDDEVAEEGSDLEGNRWHEGVNEDDDDSDIDSEEAFGASDEERFADFTFRGSANTGSATQRQRKPPTLSLDEDDLDKGESIDEEEDDELGDEGVDLATAWDLDDQDEKAVAKKQKKQTARAKYDSDNENVSMDSSDDGGSDNDEDDGESASEGEEDAMSAFSVSDDEGDHSRLQDFVQGLTSSEQQKPVKKPRHVQSLPAKPSQFGLSSTKVSAADILQYVTDPRQRKAVKIMQSNEERGYEPYTKGVPGKLAPPLARRQQDRLDRSAAYDESKKELSKWVETVKQNRRAEHLSFPLVDPAAEGMASGKQLGPTVTAEPMTALESTIQNILMESGMLAKNQGSQEDQERAYEELHEKEIPLADVQARRAELRRARDLMFREEIRARRIKKIKSKAFRRVHRKEREKAEQLVAAQGLIDSDEEREKNDRRRAEERMGARHRESKWAKSVKTTGRAAWDEDARHGVTDLAKRDEELRRRIEGKTGQGSDASESESDFDGFSGSDDERQYLDSKLNGVVASEPDDAETRLSSMAFMKRAEAARKAANEEEIQSIRRGLHPNSEASLEGDNTDDESAPTGRMVFGAREEQDMASHPRPQIEKSEFEELESDPEGNDAEAKNDPPEESSGTLAAAPRRAMIAKPGGGVELRSQPSAMISSSSPGRSSNGKSHKATADPPRKGIPAKLPKMVAQTHLDDETSSSGSDDEQDDRDALAHAIFAGSDEVGNEFAMEKKQIVEEEGDQVVDNGLPGWGSWAGEGISKKAQKRAKGRSLTTIKGVAEDKRQDAKLDKVIVNERRVKKNAKYLATELPHPFESRQQYERSLRLPLGPEWTTKSTFQDATKPRVLVKQGIIRPMAKPLA
jgi:U3 small nucleolar RNA-associated protein 14